MYAYGGMKTLLKTGIWMLALLPDAPRAHQFSSCRRATAEDTACRLLRHALMEIWFCFPVTEVERSVGTAAPGAAGAAAGGSRGLSPSPAPSSPSTPVATSSPSVSSASSSPSPSTSASALVAGLDKSVLQVSPLTYTRAWSCQDNVIERCIPKKGTYMGYFFYYVLFKCIQV